MTIFDWHIINSFFHSDRESVRLRIIFFILYPITYVPIHGHDEIILRSNSWHLSCMGLRLSTGSVLRAEVRGRRSKVSTTYFGSETLFISLSYWSDYATRCRPRLYQYIYTAIIGYGRPFLLSPASSAALFLGVVSISTPTGEPCNSIKLRAVTANWLYSASSGSMLLTGFTARCFIRWRRMKYKQEARSSIPTTLAVAPTIALADVLRPEPPDVLSRPSEDIDEGLKRDAEVPMDGSMPRAAVEEEPVVVLELGVCWAVDPVDSAVRLGMVYPAAS